MSEWKVGDYATVKIDRIVGQFAMLRRPLGGEDSVLMQVLQPLSTPDPHQALKDAVIEAAKQYMLDGALFSKLEAAVSALTAAQNPPKLDPVEVFYEVAGDNLCVCSSKTWELCRSKPDECACRRHISRGLAAVDAARGAK